MGFYPKENSPTFFGAQEKLIVTDSEGVNAPKVVRYNATGDVIVIENFITEPGMGASPPAACYSTVHNGSVVLARSARTYDNDHLNRVWFGLTAFDIIGGLTTWQTGDDGFWVDVSHEVTGLATVGGVLLIFSPNNVERVLGYETFG